MRNGILILILCLICIGLFCPVNITGEDTEVEIPNRVGEGNNPFCTISKVGIPGGIYIGQGDEFHIRVRNTYDGRLWDDTNSDSSYRNIYNAKLEIDYKNLEHDTSSDIFTGIMLPEDIGSMDVYNGVNDRGYTIVISDNMDYFNDEENNKFTFITSKTGYPEGLYRIPVKLSFNVRTGIDQSTSDNYSYSQRIIQEGYVTIFIKSWIDDVNYDNKRLVAYEDGSPIDIYSGSRSLEITYGTVSSWTDHILKNFSTRIEYDENDIVFNGTMVEYEKLPTTGKTIKWEINLTRSSFPGKHYCRVFFKYDLNQEDYNEGPYDVYLSVRNTPMLTPESPLDGSLPVIEIQQKHTISTFSIPFVNSGNVDFKSITLTLDIDSSRFISKKVKFFFEDEESKPIIEPAEFIIMNLKVGQTATAMFNDIRVSTMIPPGDYLITFDYTAEYFYGNGDTTSRTVQMDEVNRQDYLNFEYYRNQPREELMYGPYFILRVEDDEGADISARSMINIHPGTTNNRVDVTLENKELYSISDLRYVITSHDSDKVWSSDSDSLSFKLSSNYGIVIPSSDQNGPGIFEVSFFVDVKDGLKTQIIYLDMNMIFSDHMNRERVENISIPVHIIADPGALKIVSMSTSSVIPGEDFTVELEFMNTGGTLISDFDIRLISRDNSVEVLTPIQIDDTLAPGEVRKLFFTCRAKDFMAKERSISLNAMGSYIDVDGNSVNNTFMDDMPLIIATTELDEKDDLPGSVKDTGRNLLIGIISIGFLISAVLCLSLILQYKAGTKTGLEKESEDESGDIPVKDSSSNHLEQSRPQTYDYPPEREEEDHMKFIKEIGSQISEDTPQDISMLDNGAEGENNDVKRNEQTDPSHPLI